jgi:hypothetical protein
MLYVKSTVSHKICERLCRLKQTEPLGYQKRTLLSSSLTYVRAKTAMGNYFSSVWHADILKHLEPYGLVGKKYAAINSVYNCLFCSMKIYLPATQQKIVAWQLTLPPLESFLLESRMRTAIHNFLADPPKTVISFMLNCQRTR